MNRKTVIVMTAALLALGTTGIALAQSTPDYLKTQKIQEEYQSGGGSVDKNATAQLKDGTMQSAAPSEKLVNSDGTNSSGQNRH